MPSDKLDRAAYGVQDQLHFTHVPAAAWADLMPGHRGVTLLGQTLNVEGDYDCVIPTEGIADLQIDLMPSDVSGAITPVIERLRANGHAAKSVASTDAFVANTPQSITLSDLLGVKAVRLRITVGNGESVAFVPGPDAEAPAAIAEYNGS